MSTNPRHATRTPGQPTRLLPLIQSAAGNEPEPLPKLDAGDQDLARITPAAWKALEKANEPPALFRYGGLPMRIDHDDHGVPGMQPLTEPRLRHELARAACWYKVNKKSLSAEPASPPIAVVRDMLADRNVRLPVLIGITEAPTFAADGSLRLDAGYHPRAQMYYAPRPGFSVPGVPSRPTAEDIKEASALLADGLLGDFPFIGDAERAHALALLLLPFVRALIDGPTPLHLIEKPSPGTGASLMIEAFAFIATGRPVDAMTEGRDEDEWRKRVTARLRSSAAIVLIDNLRRPLDSAAVSSVITSTTWTDRLLGTSDNVRLPVRCAWAATGNNPALSAEMSRRTVRIRLDAQQDRPWLRPTTAFRHPNLRQWVREQRSVLVVAALTLTQAWLAAGRPVVEEAPTLGMFESWSQVMGGILATAGVDGFLGNLSEFYDASDTEGATIRTFLAAWWEKHTEQPVGVAALFEIATMPDSSLELGDKGERSQRSRLGRLLIQLRDRHYQLTPELTVCIRDAGKQHSAQQWELVRG